jgi:hypothetical protein
VDKEGTGRNRQQEPFNRKKRFLTVSTSGNVASTAAASHLDTVAAGDPAMRAGVARDRQLGGLPFCGLEPQGLRRRNPPARRLSAGLHRGSQRASWSLRGSDRNRLFRAFRSLRSRKVFLSRARPTTIRLLCGSEQGRTLLLRYRYRWYGAGPWPSRAAQLEPEQRPRASLRCCEG